MSNYSSNSIKTEYPEPIYRPARPGAANQELAVRCVFDSEGKFIEVDTSCFDLWGYTREELMGIPSLSLVVEEDRPLTGDVALQIMNGTFVDDFENFYICKNGTHKQILWWARWDAEKKQMHCMARESDRLISAYRPDEQSKRLYRAYRLAQIGWWEWDWYNQCFILSEDVSLIYGLSRKESARLSKADFLMRVHPEDRQRVSLILSSLQDQSLMQFEHRMLKSNGEVFYMIHYVQIDRNAKGELLKIYGTAKNITERKLVNLELERAKAEAERYANRLADTIESIDCCFFSVNCAWEITFCNSNASEFFGVKKTEVIGASFWDLVPCRNDEYFCKEMQNAMAQRQVTSFEIYNREFESWFEINVSPSTEGLTIQSKCINERKRREKELELSNERFKLISKASSDVIWDLDLATMIVEVSEAFTEIFGHTVDARNPNSIWSEHLHPDDKESVLQNQAARLADPKQTKMESQYRFKRADGSYAFISNKCIIIRNDAGEAIRLVGTMSDISARKKAELALEASEKRFRAMVQSGKDLIALFDRKFHLRYVTPNHRGIVNVEVEDISSFDVFERIHPDDRSMVETEAQRIFLLHTLKLPAFRYLATENTYRWFSVVLTNKLDDPDINSIICNSRDITETREAQEEINMLSLVTQETLDCTFIIGKDKKVIWVNKALSEKTGIIASEAVGLDPIMFFQTASPADQQYLRACFQSQPIFSTEIRLVAASGDVEWVELKCQPAFDDEGNFLYYFCIKTDITERKLNEESIRQSEEKYKLLFKKSSIPKYIFKGGSLEFIAVNDAMLDLYGYSHAEFMKMKITQIRPEAEVENLLRILDEYHGWEPKTFSGVMLHKKKDGSLINVEIFSQPIELDGAVHYMVVANDITEKVKLHEALIREKISAQKEKVKAIIQAQEKERSEIGKELHDNVNQILTTSKLYVENVRYYPEQAGQFLDKSSELIQRSIQEIRTLSKALVTPVIRDLEFKDTIAELMSSYRELNLFEIIDYISIDDSTLDKDVKLTIYRILQEQFNNSIKYAKASRVEVNIEHKNGDVCCSYRDNGIGFDLNTYKPGLGLENIRNRTDVFAGKLRIEAAPGEGCFMEICFPVKK